VGVGVVSAGSGSPANGVAVAAVVVGAAAGDAAASPPPRLLRPPGSSGRMCARPLRRGRYRPRRRLHVRLLPPRSLTAASPSGPKWSAGWPES